MKRHGGLEATRRKTSDPPIPMAATLTGYVQAAELFCQVQLQTTPAIRDSTGGFTGFISELISQRRTWQQPKEKKEPIPLCALTLLHQRVENDQRHNKASRLDKQAAVFDWLRLGVFTGSRPGEYAQTTARRNQFLTVPYIPDAGVWAGTPIAFIEEDFVFYDQNGHLLATSAAIQCRARVMYVYIRWRFDKSPRNFAIRKFRRTDHPFLDPVDAALSIVDRARTLRVPERHPLGVFRRNKAGSYTYLQSSPDVIPVIRKAVADAHPDPKHRVHSIMDRFVAHSVRVTAAVALYNVGWKREDIAFRLRWTPEAVEHYIREASVKIDLVTAQTLAGAIML